MNHTLRLCSAINVVQRHIQRETQYFQRNELLERIIILYSYYFVSFVHSKWSAQHSNTVSARILQTIYTVRKRYICGLGNSQVSFIANDGKMNVKEHKPLGHTKILQRCICLISWKFNYFIFICITNYAVFSCDSHCGDEMSG